MTSKVRNWHFSIAWIRTDVDLTKKKYEKVLFFTQLCYRLMCFWKNLACYLICKGLAYFLHCEKCNICSEISIMLHCQKTGETICPSYVCPGHYIFTQIFRWGVRCISWSLLQCQKRIIIYYVKQFVKESQWREKQTLCFQKIGILIHDMSWRQQKH